jgi:glycosyltransferase involved in cell wall biosynthesis
VAPEVTVVVPTRDRWSVVVARAVRAALQQEHVEFELLVVDDGSAQQAPASGLEDDRVRLLRHDEPRGVAAARNAGIREARGRWVAFLDDDDVWSPDKLRAQIDAATANDAEFAYSGAVWVDGGLALIQGHAPPAPATLARDLLRWNVLWGGASNVLASTTLLRTLGGFDEKLFQLADWDLWIRLANAARGAGLAEVHVGLVVHGGSMLVADRRDVFAEVEYLVRKHREAAEKAGVRTDLAAFARWVADGHLRGGRRRAAARAYVRGTTSPGNVARAVVALAAPSLLSSASRLRAAVRGALPDGERVAQRPDWLDRYR